MRTVPLRVYGAGVTSQPPPVVAVPRRTVRWLVAGALLVAAVIATVLVLTLTGSDSPTRGAVTAQAAATQFVHAVNAGDRNAAATIACGGFADEARSEAESGRDPGISFSLETVRPDGAGAATARVVQTLRLPDAPAQHISIVLQLRRISGGWLVCGAS